MKLHNSPSRRRALPLAIITIISLTLAASTAVGWRQWAQNSWDSAVKATKNSVVVTAEKVKEFVQTPDDRALGETHISITSKEYLPFQPTRTEKNTHTQNSLPQVDKAPPYGEYHYNHGDLNRVETPTNQIQNDPKGNQIPKDHPVHTNNNNMRNDPPINTARYDDSSYQHHSNHVDSVHGYHGALLGNAPLLYQPPTWLIALISILIIPIIMMLIDRTRDRPQQQQQHQHQLHPHPIQHSASDINPQPIYRPTELLIGPRDQLSYPYNYPYPLQPVPNTITSTIWSATTVKWIILVSFVILAIFFAIGFNAHYNRFKYSSELESTYKQVSEPEYCERGMLKSHELAWYQRAISFVSPTSYSEYCMGYELDREHGVKLNFITVLISYVYDEILNPIMNKTGTVVASFFLQKTYFETFALLIITLLFTALFAFCWCQSWNYRSDQGWLTRQCPCLTCCCRDSDNSCCSRCCDTIFSLFLHCCVECCICTRIMDRRKAQQIFRDSQPKKKRGADKQDAVPLQQLPHYPTQLPHYPLHYSQPGPNGQMVMYQQPTSPLYNPYPPHPYHFQQYYPYPLPHPQSPTATTQHQPSSRRSKNQKRQDPGQHPQPQQQQQHFHPSFVNHPLPAADHVPQPGVGGGSETESDSDHAADNDNNHHTQNQTQSQQTPPTNQPQSNPQTIVVEHQATHHIQNATKKKNKNKNKHKKK